MVAEGLVEVPHQTLKSRVGVVRFQHPLVVLGAVPLRNGARPLPFVERRIGEPDGECLHPLASLSQRSDH